jgi:ribosomal protein S18 acetylase RimI-like enzyme
METYNWRPVTEADLPALAALDAACRVVDGPASVPEPTYAALLTAPHTPLLGAERDAGPNHLAAVGWVQVNAGQARLGGKVHPDHRRRGLGTHLLRWSEAQAATPDPQGTLIIRNEVMTEGSAALYAQEGYTRDFAELWMQRDLGDPLPAIPPALPTESWTEANAGDFFAAYDAAFSTRRDPGTPPPDRAEWIADYADDPDFRPDISLLARADGQPVGFIAAGVLPIADLGQTVGWISQVGSHPAWRGRGVAAALIGAVLAAFQREGVAAAGLHVNVNNPGAIQLYERLGFRQIGLRAKYSKTPGAVNR